MFKEWKKEVIDDAVRKGICTAYADMMRDADSVTDLILLYRRGVEWSLENDCPSLALLRKATDAGLDRHGIFVDKTFNGETLNGRQSYIFRHCKGPIRTGLNMGLRIIPMLYFSDGCDMEVVLEGSAVKIPVYTFGKNTLRCDGIPVSFHEREITKWK